MVKYTDLSRRNQIIFATGSIITSWSALELALANCIADLMRIPRHKAVLLLAGSAARRRVELIQSLIKRGAVDLGPDATVLSATLQEVFGLEDERNNAAHRPTTAIDKGKEISRINVAKLHDRVNLIRTPLDPEKVMQTARDILRISATLEQIWGRRFPKKLSPMMIHTRLAPERSAPHKQPQKARAQSQRRG